MARTFLQFAPNLRLTSFRRWNREALLRALGFVVRCSGAATCAYLATAWVGLLHPVWATMSALVVSQEKLADTESSFKGRIAGTLIGIGAGVMAHIAAPHLAIGMAGQIALSVGACAVVARTHPTMRVCMWTGPLVLLTAEPALPITQVALYRGGEVLLGALIGAAFHWLAEKTVLPLVSRLDEPTTK